MVALAIDSHLSYFLELLNNSGPSPSAFSEVELDYQASFDSYNGQAANFAVTSVANDRIVMEDSSTGHSLTLTGTGINPATSLAVLETAIDTGLATGAFSRVVFNGPNVVGGALVDLLVFDLTPTGYVFTSGAQSFAITGATPTTMTELYDLMDLAPSLAGLTTMTPTERTDTINALAAFGVTGFDIQDAGNSLFSLSVTPTAFTMVVEGHTIEATGSFPSNFGELVNAFFEGIDIIDATGFFTSLVDITDLGLTELTVEDPDGARLLTLTGPITDSASVDNMTVTIDGVTVENVSVGDDNSDPFWGEPYADSLFGGAGTSSDHLFGLGGNDQLNGFDGNDYLYGGSGNDSFNAGDGDDYINTGTGFEGGKFVNAGRGDDIVDMVDSYQTWVGIYHDDLTAGIVASVDGVANTGTIDKGVNGTTTLLDVDAPMGYWGITIGGTAFDDSFSVNVMDGGWAAINTFGGNDTINVGSATGGILRLEYAFTPNITGITADFSAGTIDKIGTGGIDTISGSGATIEIRATDGDDDITGSAADERFILRAGNDTLDGGDGIDLVRYDRYGVGAVDVNLEAGTATGDWNGIGFNHTLTNIEDVLGSRDDDDLLVGNGESNYFQGRGGDDVLDGAGGDDILDGGDGDDTAIFNVASTDATITKFGDIINVASASGGTDVLESIEFLEFTDMVVDASTVDEASGDGDDAFVGGTGDDDVDGGTGDDDLSGGDGDDTLSGGEGDDTVEGGDGDDTVDGGEGDDDLTGGAGDDDLSGGDGDDTVEGGDGDDALSGGAGDDNLIGGAGNDDIVDGLGDNIIDGGDGDDFVVTFSGLNDISGGADSDFICGGFQSDTLNGGTGNDLIVGDSGSGFLQGADIITGGTGNDTMMGGGSADVFIFNTNDGDDIIGHFSVADIQWDPTNGYTVTPDGPDFQSGVDHIQLNGFATVNAGNVMSSVADGADGAVFSAEGTSITFFGVDMAGITADDFIFA